MTDPSGDSEFVRKEPCPSCGSRDNLARYSDGHGYCFGCQYFEHADGTSASLDAPKASGRLLQGQPADLPKRRLTEATCRKWSYVLAPHDGQTVQVANYLRDGEVVAQKVRWPNKTFKIFGDGKNLPLYGQWLWRNGGSRIVVTEGELDALSVSQANNLKWPVVSVPNGAAGAAKAVAREIEFLESYDNVIFAFDMDAPGQAAAKECAALLSPGKAYIAHLPTKDASEALQQGRTAEMLAALWEAKPYRPDGVVGVKSIRDLASEDIAEGLPWPWEGMRPTYGRRRGELYGFGGGTGCGKSTIFRQVALHVIQHDNLPVGMIMLEEPPHHTLRSLAGLVLGKRLHVPGVKVDRQELQATMDWLEDRVWFYDHFGSQGWDVIRDKIRYMVKSLGVRDIFLDHLTALAAHIDGDERKAIDKLMAELSSLTQELGCTIYYISHLTTPEGTPHEEGGRVLEKQFRGSRSIAYWSHFLFGIERDKQEQGGLMTFRILKDRYTGDSAGVTFHLKYDRDTGLLVQDDSPPEEEDNPFESTLNDF